MTTKSNTLPRIKSQGPALLSLPKGSIEIWYEHNSRFWLVQQKDSEGNQIGPGPNGTAEFFHNRADAVRALKEHWSLIVKSAVVA